MLTIVSRNFELVRKHARPPIEAVTIVWWRKSRDEFRAATEERNRSKGGRMARLSAKEESGKHGGTAQIQKKASIDNLGRAK